MRTVDTYGSTHYATCRSQLRHLWVTTTPLAGFRMNHSVIQHETGYDSA